MKPFLVIQLRPEADVADDEYSAILRRAGLSEGDTRRIRLERETLPDDLDLTACSGVIVGGGPGCVSDPPEAKTPMEARIEAQILGLMPRIAETRTPFLGCCYGIGILGKFLGAPVSQDHHGEDVGPITCRRRAEGRDDPLLDGLPDTFTALVGHKEALDALPDGAVHLLEGDACPIQMLRHGDRIYATQFHPEADGTNFALRIQVYKDKGYFPPEAAADLTARCAGVATEASGRVLANFVRHFARD
ncbi:glutamine amidotransferase [Roseibaca sp. Y0-43]|uniref:glutamine amidotransferase n=1 Tax=Roseibaca sp. Y0-43 TaxID=2816854 RepID=UPI001D0C18EA|nr:glutamine amidotransferase [Roseibaca sp. Y0-43]MCC1481642.1 glutamine amidotransferase [Roseibaca sp. Y0-43]